MNDLKTLWKSQETECAPMSLEEIRMQAGKLHSNVRWRNVREAAAAVLVIGAFGFYVWWFPDPVMRAGSVLVILGTLFVMWRLLTRGTATALPGATSALTWTDFYRSELVRRRSHLLKSVWKWYPAPLVPAGMAVFLAGLARIMPQAAMGKLAFTAALCVVVFLGVGFLNSWGARQLQKRIDALGD